MFFELEHVFDASVEAVEAAMFHPGYHAFLLANHDVLNDVSPQSRVDTGQHIRRRVHYSPKPAFDHIGPKKVPPHWFEFIEQSTWDKTSRRLTFDNVPVNEKVAQRFTSRGEIVLEKIAERKTRRRARSELKLHGLPLLLKPFGPLVEQMIAAEARRLLETEARVLTHFIASGASLRPPPA